MSLFNPWVARGEWIPDGDAGIAATIAKMKALVHSPQGVRSLVVRQRTLEAVRGTERGISEIDAIFRWIMENIEFRGEQGETLQSPEFTLKVGAGDCDDHSVLAAAMLQSLGYETRFKTVSIASSPDELSHVYLEVQSKQSGQWVPFDTTVDEAYPGWEPDDMVRSETYGTNSSGNDVVVAALVGLGMALLF